MDLATENRIATILLKEAAELRRQAEKEGALAYLRQPNIRGRPNSRFLTATVLGVQQANRAVEEGELWRARQKEKELENRLHGRSRDADSRLKSCRNAKESQKMRERLGGDEVGASSSFLARKGTDEDGHLEDDEALKDDEVDDFLHSRVKRGRGAVGSRMDETGPYLPRGGTGTEDMDQMEREKKRVRHGPEKPSFMEESRYYREDKSLKRKKKKHKEVKQTGSKEHNRSEKHKSKSRRDKDEDIKKKKKRSRD